MKVKKRGRKRRRRQLKKKTPVKRQPEERQPELSPRLDQTLEFLLQGESEKQIAARLGLSRHTVHVYVKALYKRFNVSTRAELLARWVSK